MRSTSSSANDLDPLGMKDIGFWPTMRNGASGDGVRTQRECLLKTPMANDTLGETCTSEESGGLFSTRGLHSCGDDARNGGELNGKRC